MQRHAAKNRRGGKRVSAAEKLRRFAAIEGHLSNGLGRAQLLVECEEAFGIKPRTVDSYIAEVRALWAAEASSSRLEQRQRARARIVRYLARPKQLASGPMLHVLNYCLQICVATGTQMTSLPSID